MENILWLKRTHRCGNGGSNIRLQETNMGISISMLHFFNELRKHIWVGSICCIDMSIVDACAVLAVSAGWDTCQHAGNWADTSWTRLNLTMTPPIYFIIACAQMLMVIIPSILNTATWESWRFSMLVLLLSSLWDFMVGTQSKPGLDWVPYEKSERLGRNQIESYRSTKSCALDGWRILVVT